MNKIIMTGNEAVARGFYEAGGTIASSYPGSPTVGMLEALKEYDEVYAQWSSNEKVALEIAIGGSIAGAKSMVSMKHVGINIASDPLMTFTQTKIKGGFLLVVGDDPGLSSSQNEQDSRFWGKFGNMPVFYPSNPQEVKDLTKVALRVSEEFSTPAILVLTSRLCHCRSGVTLEDRENPTISGFKYEQGRYTMLPPFANKAQYFMAERMDKLSKFNDSLPENILIEKHGSDTLLISSGMVYDSLLEINPNASLLKLAMVWPLPVNLIKDLSKKYPNIIIAEEMMPFIEEGLKVNGIWCSGKDFFPFTGELTIDVLREGLAKAGLINKSTNDEISKIELDIPNRTPMLCSGCPHRPIFHILKSLNATVIGDIGCYSLGILEPFEVHKTNISMGASLGMAIGVAEAQAKAGINKPIVATIGDGTFFHSGMTGFLQLLNTNQNITVIVMDNRTTAMTGGQTTPTTGEYINDTGLHSVNVKDVLSSFGIKDITVVDQFKYKETKDAINFAMKRPGVSVIITTQPCALNFRVKKPHYYVDESLCIGCRNCLRTNCPPISMKFYEGKDKKQSFINPDMCVGCSVCSQVCPVGAIKLSSEKED